MDFSGALLLITILIFSVMLHEVAHGWVAERFGDPTARLAGRLTLNPIKHIDPFMSILLPLLLIISGSPVIFGAAKPVPVDPFNLREGRKDMALVALAGPLTNIAVAVSTAFVIKLSLTTGFYFQAPGVYDLLSIVVRLNLLLAIFNLLPIPPLDGSKVFSLFLPEKEANVYLSLGSIGIFILFFLLLFPFGGFSLGQFIFQFLSFSERLLGL